MKTYKIFAVNPGSTSTKIAMFENDNMVFSKNVSHEAENLATLPRECNLAPFSNITISIGPLIILSMAGYSQYLTGGGLVLYIYR